MNWKQLISAKRFGMEEFHEERQENRSEFQRDYDRLIFFRTVPPPAEQNTGIPAAR